MRNTALLFTFLFFAIISFAGKTYTLTITVLDKVNSNPLPLTSVFMLSEKGKVNQGKTDILGRIVIEGLSEKRLTLSVEAQSKIYEINETVVSNSKRENISETILMSYSYDEQLRIYDEIDEQYNDSEEKFIDEKKDSVTSEFKVAEFVGGRAEMMKFLAKNMKYPQNCLEQGIEGRVYLSFYVQKDGRVTNVKAFKGVHVSLDLEAIRTLRTTPKWTPAMLNGEPIKSVFYLPVNFRLN